jgi:transposase
MGSVFFIERNGQRYAYNSTSRRVPGKKNPVTDKTYLGKVDPITGKIIPKESRKRPDTEYAKLYGAVCLLDHVQEGMGICRDLDEAFFGRGDNILGAAMSQVIDPSSFDDIHYVVDGSVIQEKLSLKGKLSPAVMSDLSKEVGGSLYCMDKFFGMRVAATTTESYAIDLTSISSYSQMDGWTEWGKNRDGEELRQINVAMVTDASGIPTMFKMLPGSIADMATLKDLVDDMERLGCRGSRLVMDRGFESASNVHGMLDLGVPFVMPSNARSEPIKKLITRAVKDMRDSSSLASHDGDTYKFIEYQVAVTEDENDDGYEYLVRLPQSEKGSAENNRRFDEGRKLKAFVVYDPKKASKDLQFLGSSIAEAEARLDGEHFRFPERQFDKLMPSVRRCLDWNVDDDGVMHVSRKQNAITFADNRTGLFVMLSSEDLDWEGAMSSYDTRNRVEEAFDAYKNDLDAGRMRTGDPERARGRLFIKFVALIMRTHIMNVLKDGESEVKDMTVEQMFRSLNTIMAIGSPGDWRLTAVTKTNRQIFEAFGLEAPKSGKISLS